MYFHSKFAKRCIDNFLIWALGHVVYEHHLADYMMRYWLFWKKKITRWQLRLHHILRSDDDRALHDHPWWYIAIILSGGYWEVTKATNDDIAKYVVVMPNTLDAQLYNPTKITPLNGKWYKRKWYGPGSILFRKATHLHRLEIPEHVQESTWTLFLTGRKSRDWGFMTEKGWMGWKEFHVLNGMTDMLTDEDMNGNA